MPEIGTTSEDSNTPNKETKTPQAENKGGISPAILKNKLEHADAQYRTLSMYPNFQPVLEREVANATPLLDTALAEYKAGRLSKERLLAYLTQDKAMQSLTGKVDELTGMEYKRPDFERFLDGVLEDIKNSDETVDVYFLDLVNFKNLNDTLGLAGGDRLLQEASQKFRTMFEDPAVIGGRVGDEFLYFKRRLKTDPPHVLEDTSQTKEQDSLPNKLGSFDTREGKIDVYFHSGMVTFDPSVDIPHIDADEHGERRVVTPAQSIIHRANEEANKEKAEAKNAHPEIYLGRQK